MSSKSVTTKKLTFLITCFLTFSYVVFSQSLKNVPTFEQYKVRTIFNGKPAPVILSNKQARMYRTRITEGAKAGVNFAGHFTVIGWGAGLGEFSFVVVDAKTGKIYFPQFDYIDASLYGVPNLEGNKDPQFRLDSKLLIFYGKKNGNSPLGIYYYVFERNRFRLVHFVKARTGHEISN
jgi:hypothetical protein